MLYSTSLKKNSNIHLCYETKKEDIKVEDRGLEYVFIQLIKNAIESMPLGGQVKIVVKYRSDGLIFIQIIDQGQGVKEEDIMKLKEPFYTTKDDGVGIALTLCDNIIREHKGSLVFKSKESKGTTAEVFLPTF